MKRYGFLGLGIMGSAMAGRLVAAGLDVTVWNRTAEKCLPLVEKGASQGSSPAEVMARCDITLAMVSDPAAATALCFDAGGILEGVAPGKAYIDFSTVDPATTVRIGEAVTGRGGRFLEGPVSGSKKPAEDGTLVFLCAGDQSLYREAAPVLGVMGKKSYCFKEVGQGAQMKLIVNMLLGTVMTSLGEGLALGDKAGLQMADILEVLTQGPLDNPLFRMKGPQMIDNNYATAFPLKHMQKDLRLALQLGDTVGQSLFTAGAANNLFLKARQTGSGDEDFAAVFKTIKS